MEDSVGSISITVSTDDFERTIYLSFEPDGSVNIDRSDAYQLMPLQLTPHLVSMTYSDDTALDIQNLPSTINDGLTIPLDVMMLGVDGNQFMPMEVEGAMTWDISQLPDHIDLKLTNQVSGETTHLRTQESTTFTTQSKSSFGYTPGIVTTYPGIGESLYTLTITQSALESGSHSLPKSFELHTVYPNPFNPSTSIKFDIPKMSHTVLEVFNIKGQLVETLLNKPMQPGSFEVHWTPENLSSGVYMVRLTSGEKVMNQKVTFVK